MDTTMCNDEEEWRGCYSSNAKWNRYLDKSTNAHPAKGAMNLFDRIFKHLEILGLLKPGDKVIDFMSGTGRTAILAQLHGYPTITLELEPHFIKMEEQNKAVLKQRMQKTPDWEILQGDARHLSEILKEKGVGIMSPPYGDNKFNLKHGLKDLESNPNLKGRKDWASKLDNNPTDPNNIINLPDKQVGIISPPYGEAHGEGGGLLDTDRKDLAAVQYMERIHGAAEGQIANLKDNSMTGIVSPPYEKQVSIHDPDFFKDNKNLHGIGSYKKEYGNSPEQIGNMKDSELVGVVSPPYIDQNRRSEADIKDSIDRINTGKLADNGQSEHKAYSQNKENIGNEQSETYLSAMLQVYKEAFKSGITPLVTVTKNPTKEGKLRRLDLDTAKLISLAGYKIVDYHRAILFEDRQQHTLMSSGELGATKKHVKGRLSFFKRVSVSKGNVAAQWEDIIIAVIV